MKTLLFEGAGWSESDSSGDVGNCRIRTTFLNDRGREIYLEMNGATTHKHSPGYLKQFVIGGWISHLFYTSDHRASYSQGLTDQPTYFEWNKKNILHFVNSRLGCSFDAIEVRDEWCGFALDGKPENDFHLKAAK